MPNNTIGKLSTEFPTTIYCEPPEVTGREVWAVRGMLQDGIELREEHPNLLSALARFGTAFYKLKREAKLIQQTQSIGEGAAHGCLQTAGGKPAVDGASVCGAGDLGNDQAESGVHRRGRSRDHG